MGLLNNGIWQDKWYDTDSTGGRFERHESQFRNWITADGSAGPNGKGGFKAEPGRYHLYVSYACPWAHRALILRKLKGLEDMIDVSYTHWFMGENGWTFKKDADGIVGDKLFGSDFMYELYIKADPHYTGRVTVPTLWDKQQNTIVSNESADIVRMFNSAFDGVGATDAWAYSITAYGRTSGMTPTRRAESSSGPKASSATGSPPTAPPGRQATAASRQSRGAIISMSPMPAPGRTGR